MRRYPKYNLTFIFEKEDTSVNFRFWKIPVEYSDPKFVATVPDYKLTLTKPLELTNSMATDDFCPRHFEVDWYVHFMNANPLLTGKVVIDTSKKDFLTRAVKYRKQLEVLGVDPSRVRFLRHHFPHETDEQWWLIPPKRK